MKAIIFGISLVVLPTTSAFAGTTCTKVGIHTICNDTDSGTRTTCTQVGSTIICN